MTSDLVRIASPALSAQINPFGAELWRLQDGEGRDLLWDGDPAWWAGRAPLLFPIVGCLPDNRYTHAGRTFELPRHGFARRRAFEVVRQQPALARFRLAADAQTREAYPFDFVLEVEFEIQDAELRTTVSIANRGAEPMPATFGFHPAFRWPLPGAGERSDHAITFADEEPGPLRRVDAAGLLGAERMPAPTDGRLLPLRDELFVEDALIFEAPRSRSLRYGGAGGPSLAISWTGLPHLGIWTKPGAPYICIEPWHGMSAQAQAPSALTDRPDLLQLAPGAAEAFSMTVRLD
ncbi:aldose 1-epimerase family protein [Phenylobacterium sp. LjRoot225]|uniref:aldose 1-epimerase family protein n=1 Tax=Phenylobacterium sp. LjRoot225 TaxID=3342285 RepID=UPI003ECE54EA